MKKGLYSLIILIFTSLAYGFEDTLIEEIRGSNLQYAKRASPISINIYPTKNPPLSLNNILFNDWSFSISPHDPWQWNTNAFYIETIYSRFTYSETSRIHIARKNSDFAPLSEVDWNVNKEWKINATFPLDFSLHYLFGKRWSTALSYRSFGGWYRSFYRIEHEAENHESIPFVYANGLDLGFYLNTPYFSAGFFGGANFSGFLIIQGREEALPFYFEFDAAAYGGIRGSIRF